MSITRDQVNDLINANLPTNNVGFITATLHRAVVMYILDYIDQKSKTYSGTEEPSGELGLDGDYYILINPDETYTYFKKESNSWIEVFTLGSGPNQTIFFNTTGALPVANNVGDWWFNFKNQALYFWDGNIWSAFHTVGPRTYFGTVDPTAGPTYKSFDVYFNLVNGKIFKYNNSGAWVLQGNLPTATTTSTITSVTYAGLQDLIGTSQLTPGGYYLITDYRSTGDILGSQYTHPTGQEIWVGEPEPLIIRATDPSDIHSVAVSLEFPQDIIHYSPDGDNTTNKIDPVQRGAILYRKDPFKDISAYFDWRNAKVRRWETVDNNGQYYAFQPPSGSPSYQDSLVFGTKYADNRTRIHLAAGTKNVQIGINCYDIIIGSGCAPKGVNGEFYDFPITTTGYYDTGITIGESVRSVNIASGCATVQTTGSGYVGGITILDNSWEIYIGQRCYNIAIGANCYAIHLGTQNSDIAIPPSTTRRRIEKGFSNFEATVTLDNDTVDLYNTRVNCIPNVLYSTANYCGVIKLEATSPLTDPVYIRRIIGLSTSLAFHDIQFYVGFSSSFSFIFQDQGIAADINEDANISLRVPGIEINSSDTKKGIGNHIILYKVLQNGLGSQTNQWYLKSTNSLIQNWPDITYVAKKLPIDFSYSFQQGNIFEIGIVSGTMTPDNIYTWGTDDNGDDALGLIPGVGFGEIIVIEAQVFKIIEGTPIKSEPVPILEISKTQLLLGGPPLTGLRISGFMRFMKI